eukprot:scaffold25941_cov23-Prasinocladus_malaysianus.AAC.1
MAYSRQVQGLNPDSFKRYAKGLLRSRRLFPFDNAGKPSDPDSDMYVVKHNDTNEAFALNVKGKARVEDILRASKRTDKQ